MKRTFALLPSLLFAPLALQAAELKLHRLFSDHMVLQREAVVPVWGWADAGVEIGVTFAGQKKTAKVGSDGQWMVKLEPLTASAEPRELVVEAAGKKLTLTDVLVGDVWLCSGQSNMAHNLNASLNPAAEIAAARYPELRLFTVKQNPVLEPVADVEGQWIASSPQSVPGFSAAAYFFGRELHRELKIPVGLLHSSIGATRAEGWTRLEVLQTEPIWTQRAEQERAQFKTQEEDSLKFPAERDLWEKKYGVSPPPVSEAAKEWADPALDTSDWKPVNLPASWAQLGAKSGGVFWVRKEVNVPESAAGKPTSLSLNWLLEQYDTAYVNGVEVGRANDKPPTFYNIQRGYWMPTNLLKPGRNVIAVRIVSATERSGMGVSPNPLGLPPTEPGANDSRWLMKIESSFPPLPPDALKSRPRPNTIPAREVSSCPYNGMIAPLIPFGIKGAIWYQGEGNASRANEYRNLLSRMIGDWRAQWGQGDFPFLIQQLVNNGAPMQDPNSGGNWPFLREAQAQVADNVPHCGIAIGMEIGSPHDLHPPDKQNVGKRLALVALEKVYGKSLESSGPRYESQQVEGQTIRLKFSHAKGLLSKEGPPRNFAIADRDHKFVWADAKIEGEEIVVSSPQVQHPVAVRYAWADNPPQVCNLYNSAGLPAAPFRTDDLPWPVK